MVGDPGMIGVADKLQIGGAVVGDHPVAVVEVVAGRDGETGANDIDEAMQFVVGSAGFNNDVAFAVQGAGARRAPKQLGVARGRTRPQLDSAELTLPGAGGLTTGPIQRWRGQGSLQVRRPLAEGEPGRRI